MLPQRETVSSSPVPVILYQTAGESFASEFPVLSGLAVDVSPMAKSGIASYSASTHRSFVEVGVWTPAL